MIGVYHATNLNLVSRACPFALELQERGVPADRSVYQAGIAAHAVMEGVSLCTNEINRELTPEEVNVAALGVCERLMSVGRSYDGKGEPPMAPEAVFAGQEIALGWLLWNPIQPGGQVEVGLGLDGQGRPCEYWKGEGLKVRTILDEVRIIRESDEESARTVLAVRDYKTAWSTDDSELDTLQRRIQAVAAWRHFGPADVLRLEVANLRLGKVYTRELYREDGLDEQIETWWLQVAATCRALDAQKALGPRPAAPGRGCLSCPYIGACDHASDFMERAGMHRTPEQRAIAFCVAAAVKEELAAQLRIDTDEQPVKIADGEVGYRAKERQKLKPDAYVDLWGTWSASGGGPDGFAKGLKLTKANAENVAKLLYPERGQKRDRDAWLAELMEPENVREFGAWPAEEKS